MMFDPSLVQDKASLSKSLEKDTINHLITVLKSEEYGYGSHLSRWYATTYIYRVCVCNVSVCYLFITLTVVLDDWIWY